MDFSILLQVDWKEAWHRRRYLQLAPVEGVVLMVVVRRLNR